eukprot:TRINITY_DN11367_c0_g1_i2.p1 TRINITY_DN11367_c0_g1~~TRINITY_DN11367_c0_g1_i2.p1  ORF type:complete len:271 (+),score=50.75 TRINITY_DN11367_c0_g1_i2:209-1021(+)
MEDHELRCGWVHQQPHGEGRNASNFDGCTRQGRVCVAGVEKGLDFQALGCYPRTVTFSQRRAHSTHALSIKPTHAVLSVGGNDVREVLKRMAQLPSQMRLFLSNYVKITESVLEALQSPRLVLMLQYRPCINTDKKFYGVYAALGSLPLRHEGGVMAVMNGLMEAVYPAILALARRKGLPVIDLPRSFDPHDEDLYDHQIEPAAKGSDVIAGLVAHTLQHHQWGGPSMFYFRAPGSDKVTAEENREGEKWRVDPEVPGPDLSAFMGSVGA